MDHWLPPLSHSICPCWWSAEQYIQRVFWSSTRQSPRAASFLSVYINDLPDCISSSTTRLFADDNVVYREVSSHDDAANLQKDLDALQAWESKWLMRFNAAKCQVLQVTNKRNPFPASYTIHGQVLETVNSAKYLGVHLDPKLNFNNHVDSITRKANCTRAFFSRNLWHTSQKVKEAVHTTFIRQLNLQPLHGTPIRSETQKK